MNSSGPAIRAIGMVTPVGWGFEDSCASIRAGITRPSPVSDYPLLDPDTQDQVPLVGYRVPVGADGFDTVGKWLTIGVEAMRDLIANLQKPGPLEADFWQATQLIVVCPSLDPERFQSSQPQDPGVLLNSYLAPLVGQLGVPIQSANTRILAEGQSGFFTALLHAAQSIREGPCKRSIVLATESCLDSLTLEWLDRFGRLKSADNPAGLVPGEAAVALCIDDAEAGQSLAQIDRVAVRTNGDDFFFGNARNGESLTAVLSEVLGDQDRPVWDGDLISDQNGEAWRAWEFACARSRVNSSISEEVRVVLPAISTGETGVASGAIGVACAAAGISRGYAAGSKTLVLSSSEFGSAAAAIISPPSGT